LDTFSVSIHGKALEVIRDHDGAFVIPEEIRPYLEKGTALKPAWEPICVARKPLDNCTVAENVHEYSTGALHIEGCRIEATGRPARGNRQARPEGTATSYDLGSGLADGVTDLGRFPANVIHDGSEEVISAFPRAPGQKADLSYADGLKSSNVYNPMRRGEPSSDKRYAEKGSTDFAMKPGARRSDTGSAARFFYSAKADSDDRLLSKHPTVKPVDLMAYLCRLVTPPGGTVLDCFAGSGTTGMACLREGFNVTLIEREAEYVADIKRRIAHVSGTDTPLLQAAQQYPHPALDDRGFLAP
jgi:site-specific DNA-methyltransferase (adenine-specific)